MPGNAQVSEIIRRVEGLASPRMPFDGPPWLLQEQISLLRDWINEGAKGADGVPAPLPVGGRLRLRGVMTGHNQIDGVGFIITNGTRVEEIPALGHQTELRARIGPNGELIATRLRER